MVMLDGSTYSTERADDLWGYLIFQPQTDPISRLLTCYRSLLSAFRGFLPNHFRRLSAFSAAT